MASPTGNLAWQELTQAEEQSQQHQHHDDQPIAGPSSRKPANHYQKAVAACSGAVTTSLLMTPFDVIKTRLQTQSAAEPLFTPSSHISASHSANAKGKAPAFSRAHAATCCQQTFFTGNKHEESLTCKFDPRVAQTKGTAANPAAAAGSGTASASSSGGGMSSSVAATAARSRSSSMPSARPSHPRAPYAHSTAYANPSSGAAAVMRQHPSSTCAYPSQNVATLELEAATRQHRMTGLLDGVAKVRKAEGVRGLWRGLSPTLLMTIPSQVTYMTCYDHFRAFFLSLGEAPASVSPTAALLPPAATSNITSHTLLASLASGALSRAVSATLVTPLELVRTRLQASDVSHSLSSIVSSLSSQVRSQGPSVLFRGLPTTLWRDVPFSAIYFMGYETLKRYMTGGSGLGEGEAKGGLEEFRVAFVSGAVSGSVAAVVTHPFDLVKTRLQAAGHSGGTQQKGGSVGSSGNSNSSASARTATATATAQRSTSQQTMGALKAIMREEGWRGMFKGLSPRVAKVAPACGLMIGSYEAVGTIFALAEGD